MENHNLLEDLNIWGIGIMITKNKIKKFIRNSPAYISDLKTNDIIISVDGELVKTDLIDLSGKFNSYVDLCILREKTEINMRIKRTFKINNWSKRDFVAKM